MARPRDEALALAAITAAVVLLAAPLLAQPWTIDEPAFLAVARHILRDPLHPYAFRFNWYGHLAPMRSVDGNPPLFPYLLALCWKLGGAREWAVRLLLLPLDVLAAFGVYGLAKRFTRRPVWPTLAVLATPAWAVDLPHAMPECLLAALALPALHAALRGIDEGEERSLWASAALFSGALLTKYAGVFLLAPVALYALLRGFPRGKLALFLAASCAPLAAYLILERAGGGLAAASHLMRASGGLPYAGLLARSRATAAFAGGAGLGAAAWALAGRPPRPASAVAGVVLAAALFLPAAAAWPARAQGLVLACAAWCALEAVWSEGELFLKLWTVCGLALVACYWSVTARTTLFLAPPLVFSAARRLESRLAGARLQAVQGITAAALAALSLALARVDARYARAQRAVAELAARAGTGGVLWCASHWGLQHYLAERGAQELDWSLGGWDQVKPGDVVVLSRVNSDVLWPDKRILAQMRSITVTSPIPLRLMSGWGGQAGFYSSQSGFLPFALSREPLDEFLIAEIAPPEKPLHAVHGASPGPGL